MEPQRRVRGLVHCPATIPRAGRKPQGHDEPAHPHRARHRQRRISTHDGRQSTPRRPAALRPVTEQRRDGTGGHVCAQCLGQPGLTRVSAGCDWARRRRADTCYRGVPLALCRIGAYTCSTPAPALAFVPAGARSWRCRHDHTPASLASGHRRRGAAVGATGDRADRDPVSDRGHGHCAQLRAHQPARRHRHRLQFLVCHCGGLPGGRVAHTGGGLRMGSHIERALDREP